MVIRLYDYTVKEKILCPTQHGFQAGHSPYMSLLNMHDKITNAMDNNEYSVGVFFDLSKAFDTVNHDILLQKLYHYGIRGMQFHWFKSYLTERSQYVCCKEASSSIKNIRYGVPQGSILGPILFLIYINDLPNVSNCLFFVLFADDTNVFDSHKSLDALFQIINTELKLVADWFRENRLTVNFDKTSYIIFKSYKKARDCFNLGDVCINEINLTQVRSTKFLGVFVDQHLDWKEHINYISAKVARNVGILTRAFRLLPKTARIKLYYAIVFPYLSYCNIVWASTYKTSLRKLIVIQKGAIRVIASANYGFSTKQSFSDLNLLNIEQIRLYQVGEFVFHFHHGLLPPVFADFYTLVSKVHTYGTRQCALYHRPYARTNVRRFSITVEVFQFGNALHCLSVTHQMCTRSKDPYVNTYYISTSNYAFIPPSLFITLSESFLCFLS